MALTGPFFYDNDAVFATYIQRRNSKTSANDTLEKPILMDLLPSPAGKDFLDLGCGEATLAEALLAAGATSYLGLDGSANMVARAHKQLKGSPAQVEQAFLENWEYPAQRFDCVVSRLALHYIEDLGDLIGKIHHSLRPGGELVFSVEHPVITSHQAGLKDGADHNNWLVDRYFQTGKREYPWLGAPVLKYHRTLEDYYRLLRQNHFDVLDLRESRPRPEHFSDRKLYERRMRIPLFILFKARRCAVDV
jgi:SAM-dependent methyltransferase